MSTKTIAQKIAQKTRLGFVKPFIWNLALCTAAFRPFRFCWQLFCCVTSLQDRVVLGSNPSCLDPLVAKPYDQTHIGERYVGPHERPSTFERQTVLMQHFFRWREVSTAHDTICHRPVTIERDVLSMQYYSEGGKWDPALSSKENMFWCSIVWKEASGTLPFVIEREFVFMQNHLEGLQVALHMTWSVIGLSKLKGNLFWCSITWRAVSGGAWRLVDGTASWIG